MKVRIFADAGSVAREAAAMVAQEARAAVADHAAASRLYIDSKADKE